MSCHDVVKIVRNLLIPEIYANSFKFVVKVILKYVKISLTSKQG